MRDDNIFNRKNLKHFRSALRKRSTSAELVLWNLLKSKKVEGRKFRRQQSIGKYIVDFYCPGGKLIIELDGDYHGDFVQIQKDITRDSYFQELGFTILRFENRIVFQNPEIILNEIRKKIQN